MIRAQIVSPWAGSGTMEDPFRPGLVDDYAIRQRDVTGQPVENLTPEPNAYTIEVECTDSILAEIEADFNYVVRWSEQI